MNQMFTWCKDCAFFAECYNFGKSTIPSYVDPKCGNGPVKKEHEEEASR